MSEDFSATPCTKSADRPLRILITNAWLGDRRGGTELYALDVGAELLRRGHSPMLFSPRLGGVAEEARARGIPVFDDLQLVEGAPDVIHGQHHVETMTALCRFPGTPAVFFCQSARFWDDIPPRHPRVRRFVACDLPTSERLIREWDVDPALVEMVPQFVDLRLFRKRNELPARPKRALVFSHYAGAQSHLPAVQQACEAQGIQLDVVGSSSGTQTERPQDVLGQYDVVFAKARSALEAMAVGVAVVVCDFDGVGPMVTSSNFDDLRALNFGYRAQSSPLEPSAVITQLALYDAVDAGVVSARARSEAGLERAVDSVLRIYREAMADNPPVSWPDEVNLAGKYIHWLNPFLREREQSLVWASRLLDIAEERDQAIQRLTRALEERTTHAEQLGAAADERLRLIRELDAIVRERTKWAEGLLREAEKRGRLIQELDAELRSRKPSGDPSTKSR